MVVFLGLWLAAMYSWIQVIKYRRAGLQWWSPIWSTNDLQPEGHRYFRRFMIFMVSGVVTVLVVIGLEFALRSS